MELSDIVNTVQPYASATAVGSVLTMGVYSGVSTVRGLARGTTVLQQFRNPINMLVGLAAGGAATLGSLSHPMDYNLVMPYLGDVLALTGVATWGSVTGAVARPVFNAMRTTDGLLDNLPVRSREGAVRGTIAASIAYGALLLLGRYLP